MNSYSMKRTVVVWSCIAGAAALFTFITNNSFFNQVFEYNLFGTELFKVRNVFAIMLLVSAWFVKKELTS